MVADYDLAVRNLGTCRAARCSSTASRSEPGIGRRGGMAWAGDNAIEIGQPIGEGGAAQFVSRFGGGMHSIALQVEDLQATMAHLDGHGVRIAARPRPEMCFSDPRDTGGVFLQWSSFELAVDPRFGARPARTCRTRSGAGHAPRLCRRAGRGPRAWAAASPRCSAPPSPSSTPRAPRPARGRACRWATAPSPSSGCRATTDRALWGRTYERARTHLLALRVEDLGAATAAIGTGPASRRAWRAPTSSCSTRRRPEASSRAHRIAAPGRPAPLIDPPEPGVSPGVTSGR